MEGSVSDSERTPDLLREEGSRLVKGLSFTVDCQERNPDGKCPMLDLKVWKETEGDCATIRHMFYETEVTSPLVFHAKGAHTWKLNLVRLGEEVRRRLQNTDRKHTEAKVLEILTKFSQKMTDSDYDVNSRQEVLKSGMRKYYTELAQAVREGTHL